MERYKQFINYLGRIQVLFCALVLIVMVAINAIEIFQRNILGSSFSWVQELSIILFCWLVFIGASYIYNNTELIKMDLFYSKAIGLTKFIWDLVIGIVFLATMVIIVIYGYEYAVTQYSARTESLKLPFTLYSLPLVIGAVLMALGTVKNLYEFFKEYKQYKEKQMNS